MLAFRLMDYLNYKQWEVSFLDIVVLIGYFVLMMVVGYICKKSSSNVSDYVRMSCKSTWWLMGLSIFMQAISALTFTASSSQAYLAGWSAFVVVLSGAAGLLCQAIFFAPWLRRTRAVTPADAVKLRFGPKVEQIYVYAGVSGSMFWGGVMLLSLSSFVSATFNVPVQTIVVFVGLIVVFYSVSGGSWSVQITDTLQAFIMIPICIVIAVLSLKLIGGLGGLFDAISQSDFAADYAFLKESGHQYAPTKAGGVAKGLYTLPWAFAAFCDAFIKSVNLTGCHRYLSTKTDTEARKAATFAAILMICGSSMWLLPPMVCRLKFSQDVDMMAKVEQAEESQMATVASDSPDTIREIKQETGLPAKKLTGRESAKLDNPADGAYAIIAQKVLPPGLLGLIIVAMFAATMSSLDSFLTGTAGSVTNNMYPALARVLGFTPLTGRPLLNLTKLVNFLLGCWAICLALLINHYGKGGIYQFTLQIVLLLGAPTGLPYALTFFVKKLPSWGPLVGMGCGLLGSFNFVFGTKIAAMTGYQPFIEFEAAVKDLPWHIKLFINFGMALIPTFLTILFWNTQKEHEKQRAKDFYKQLATPIDFKKEVGESADHSLLIMVGTLGLIISGGIMLLLLSCKDTSGVLSVLFIAGFVATVSGIMLINGRKKAKVFEAEHLASSEAVIHSTDTENN